MNALRKDMNKKLNLVRTQFTYFGVENLYTLLKTTMSFP
jgi:hypothetical protein